MQPTMKVNLIVTAAGPNNGRAIAIVGGKFLIGRDPQCHLRPASQAISHLHCAVIVRDGKVFAEDYGSTNGTQLDGETFTGVRELTDGCALKMGPLEFKVQIQQTQLRSDSTPVPDALKGKTPAAATKPAATKSPEATKPAASAPVPITSAPIPADGDSSDDIDAAAMLLGLDDTDDPAAIPHVPEGSTVHEMTAVNADGTPAVKKEEPKKKGTPSGAQMSAAANDILRKYIRRTGN